MAESMVQRAREHCTGKPMARSDATKKIANPVHEVCRASITDAGAYELI
jgi:hypothetical protein